MKKLRKILGRVLLGLVIVFLLAFPVAAETVTVHVGGLVCGLCAQGIQKKMSKLDGVKSFKVSLEDQRVDVALKAGSALKDDVLRKTLEDSGFRVFSIERNP